MLGLRFCARAFPSCSKRGPLFIAVRGPLTVAVSPAAEHRLQTRRPSNCGSRAQPLRGMWDPPRPGPKPVSPALSGGLSTTAPPGKPPYKELLKLNSEKTSSTIRKWAKDRERHLTEEDVQMANKHMKRCSILLAISEMQIKTTMRHHYTPIRMAKIKNSDNTKGQ